MLPTCLPRTPQLAQRNLVLRLDEDYRTELHLHKFYAIMAFAVRDWQDINQFIAHAFSGFGEYTLCWYVIPCIVLAYFPET